MGPAGLNQLVGRWSSQSSLPFPSEGTGWPTDPALSGFPSQDTLLLYYAPWCGFCMALNHVFIQLARILPDNFVVAR